MKGGEDTGAPQAGGEPADPYDADGPDEAFATEPSLLDEIEGLIEDGKTYFDAEIGFQKTRAAFAGSQVKTIAIAAVVAVVVLFVAVLALAVGLIIALTPHVTAWGATALVAGGLLLVVAILVGIAMASWKALVGAFKSNEPGGD